MILDCDGFESNLVYHVMVQTIIPRPIAWVLSDNGNASYNLAPFSFFNGVSSDPPLLMISIGRKPDGIRKDTWVNIEERKFFVVHIPPVELIQQMVDSSAPLEHGESEVTRVGAQLRATDGFALPRVIGPKAAFFCEKHQIFEVGNGPQGLILGRIRKIWMEDDVIRRQDGRVYVDAEKLNPVARLGGEYYTLLGKRAKVRCEGK